MGIRDAFKMTWEQAVLRGATMEDVEIFPEQRTILRSVKIGQYPIAEYCVMYGDSEYPNLISTRFMPDVMLIPAYIHVLEQRKRLKEEGITSRVVYQRGLLQCVYVKEAYLRSLQ